MYSFHFSGYEKIRDLAGRYRTLSAAGFYDDALQYIVVNEAERARLMLVSATPVRSGRTAQSWHVGGITKSGVRVYTTEWQNVKDLVEGTLDKAPITPTDHTMLKWKGDIPSRSGIYFRPQVAGQAPNVRLAEAVYVVRHLTFNTQVVSGRISEATRRARL